MSAHRTHAIYDKDGALITLATNNVPHAERLAHLYSTSSRKNKPFTARPVVVLPAEEYEAMAKDAERWRAFAEDAHIQANDDGEVMLLAYLASDIETINGATADEKLALQGELPPQPEVTNLSFGIIAGAQRIGELWDAAQQPHNATTTPTQAET